MLVNFKKNEIGLGCDEFLVTWYPDPDLWVIDFICFRSFFFRFLFIHFGLSKYVDLPITFILVHPHYNFSIKLVNWYLSCFAVCNVIRCGRSDMNMKIPFVSFSAFDFVGARRHAIPKSKMIKQNQ